MMERQNIFEAIEEIRTIDSDVEPETMESDDEMFDPSWIMPDDRSGPSNGRGARRRLEASFVDDDTDNSNDETPVQVHQGCSNGPPAQRRRHNTSPVADVMDESDEEAPVPVVIDDDGWTRNLEGFPEDSNFSNTPQLHLPEDCNTALGIFDHVFTKDILKFIKSETNRYAAQQKASVGDNVKENSIYKLWKTVSMNDLRGFLCILIHMSLIKKPRISDYWCTKSIIDSSYCSTIMSRDRFLQILAFLHFSNNEEYIPRGQVGHKPLHKIQFVYDSLRNKFSSLYKPHQKLCIDEAICPWRGRLAFRVYMRDKPCKWGIKLYELCESNSGYVLDFKVYCGDPELSNSPTDVCLRLMQPYFGLGHILYTDNYYTCPKLTHELLQRRTMSVGTVRANRKGMPKSLAAQNVPRGETDFRRKEGMSIVKWTDKKVVNVLTTVHDPTAVQLVTTRTGRKIKPIAVQDYVLNMSGVDRSDQMVAYHPLHRRAIKWTKKLFMHLLTLCFIQSRILYNKKMELTGGKKVDLYNFLVTLGTEKTEEFHRHRADALSRISMEPQTPPTPTSNPALRLSSLHGHFPENIPATATKAKPYRACKVCYEKSRRNEPGHGTSRSRKETRHWYPVCKIALCVTPCFSDFHRKKNYV